MATNDVLRPDKVDRSFALAPADHNDDYPDLLSMLSVIAGVLCMIIKYRWLGWVSLVAGIMYVANTRTESQRWNNVLTSSLVSVASLVMAYFGPSAHMFV